VWSRAADNLVDCCATEATVTIVENDVLARSQCALLAVEDDFESPVGAVFHDTGLIALAIARLRPASQW
jgi:hypothetical protein